MRAKEAAPCLQLSSFENAAHENAPKQFSFHELGQKKKGVVSLIT
jgi:hypothetical protein